MHTGSAIFVDFDNVYSGLRKMDAAMAGDHAGLVIIARVDHREVGQRLAERDDQERQHGELRAVAPVGVEIAAHRLQRHQAEAEREQPRPAVGALEPGASRAGEIGELARDLLGHEHCVRQRADRAGLGQVRMFAPQPQQLLVGAVRPEPLQDLVEDAKKRIVLPGGRELSFTVSQPGEHWIGNAMAVLGAVFGLGGALAGWLHFQNHDLVDARNQLGQMATAFAYAINDAQAIINGLDRLKQQGIDTGRVTMDIDGHVCTITVDNTGNILNGDYYFARKFDLEADPGLLDRGGRVRGGRDRPR